MMRSLRHEDPQYFAIVSHMPYKIAQRVIRKLDGAQLNGDRVTVRQYRPRSWKADRRQKQDDARMVAGEERRTVDRRACWVVTDVNASR
jgi:hypothetical protein